MHRNSLARFHLAHSRAARGLLLLGLTIGCTAPPRRGSPEAPIPADASRGLQSAARNGVDAGEYETLTVATLNLAHGRGLVREQLGLAPQQYRANIEAVAEVVRRYRPDVLAVQEADAPSFWSGWFNHVELLADEAGYPHVFHGLHFQAGFTPLGGAYGTALLARLPLRNLISTRFDYRQTHTKGFVTAQISFAGRDVVVVSAHLASGSAGDRRREAEIMVSELRKGDLPIILMGDLNSEWSNESDAVRLLARQLNLAAFRSCREVTAAAGASVQADARGSLHTFRADEPRKRVDWILISPQLELVGYRVWPEPVSDHLGVSARIRWRR